MNRSCVKELYFITHIDNLKTILELGILCNRRAKKIIYKSIADPVIQKRRENAVIPGGKHKLHDYANLYFNPRNPMMFKRKDIHQELVILRIYSGILDKPGVVISDMNAASDYVRFYPSPDGLKYLNKDLIFTKYWTDPNPIIAYQRKSAICAEVLVPDSVEPKYITGIYVSCQDTYEKLVELLDKSPLSGKISIKPKLFFLEV